MKARAKQPDLPPDSLAWYDKLIATNPEIERKGVSLPYTSINGNMFTFLSQSGTVAIRLPADVRETFLRKYRTNLMEAHGAIMTEYAAVPEPLLKKTSELKRYFEISYAYAKTLKPKGQKKGKAASPKQKRS